MGQAFLPTLREALTRIDSATEAIMTTARDRTVILACPISLAENWIADCLVSFFAAYPEIEVVIYGTVWENAGEQIADLTITVNRDDEVPDGSEKLYMETLSLVCAPRFAEAVKTPSDLVSQPKIFVLGRQEYWSIYAKALGLDRFDLDKGIKTNASNISLEMAARGLGFTASLSSLAKTYVDRKLLVELFDSRPASPWSYYVSLNGVSHGRAAIRLKQWLIDAGKAQGTS